MFKTVISVCGVNIVTQDITIDTILSPDDMHLGNCLRMDSHTYTICVNIYIFIESTVGGMIFDEVTFDESIGKTIDLPVLNAVYSYDNPNKFCTIILRINHAIYIKDMKHSQTKLISTAPSLATSPLTLIIQKLVHSQSKMEIIPSLRKNMVIRRTFTSDVHHKRNLNISLSLPSRMRTIGIPTRHPTIFLLSIQHQYSSWR